MILNKNNKNIKFFSNLKNFIYYIDYIIDYYIDY